MRYGQPSIFELGRLDSFNSCPDLRQTQAEMGIKLRLVVASKSCESNSMTRNSDWLGGNMDLSQVNQSEMWIQLSFLEVCTELNQIPYLFIYQQIENVLHLLYQYPFQYLNQYAIVRYWPEQQDLNRLPCQLRPYRLSQLRQSNLRRPLGEHIHQIVFRHSSRIRQQFQ